LPKFEELDTTNMLLRQRIIFLGSQVFFFSFLF
jgi:ATP-dependent Clp protease protease subunit